LGVTRILRSARTAAALAVLVAFNLAALAWFANADGAMRPVDFAVWFVGDLLIGLVALALTESR
jgi:hypothetical protein